MEQQNVHDILVIWRGRELKVEVNQHSKVRELGQKLQILTNVKPDTMRLLVPQSTNKSSKLITPFSDVHSSLSLQEASILVVRITLHPHHTVHVLIYCSMKDTADI